MRPVTRQRRKAGLVGKVVADGTWFLRHDPQRKVFAFMLKHPDVDDAWASTMISTASTTVGFATPRRMSPKGSVSQHTSFKGRTGFMTTAIDQFPEFFVDSTRPAPHVEIPTFNINSAFMLGRTARKALEEYNVIRHPPKPILHWVVALRNNIQWKEFLEDGKRDTIAKAIVYRLGSVKGARGNLNIANDVINTLEIVRRIQDNRSEEEAAVRKNLQRWAALRDASSLWKQLIDDWLTRLSEGELNPNLLFTIGTVFLQRRFLELIHRPDILRYLLDPDNATFVHEGQGIPDLLRNRIEDDVTFSDQKLFKAMIGDIASWKQAIQALNDYTARHQQRAEEVQDPLLPLRSVGVLLRDLIISGFTFDDLRLSGTLDQLPIQEVVSSDEKSAQWAIEVPQLAVLRNTPPLFSATAIDAMAERSRSYIRSPQAKSLMIALYDALFKGWRDAFGPWHQHVLQPLPARQAAVPKETDPLEESRAVVAEVNTLLAAEERETLAADQQLMSLDEAEELLDALSSQVFVVVDDDVLLDDDQPPLATGLSDTSAGTPSWTMLRQAIVADLAWTQGAIQGRRDLIAAMDGLYHYRTDADQPPVMEQLLITKLASLRPEALSNYLELAATSPPFLGQVYALSLVSLARDIAQSFSAIRDKHTKNISASPRGDRRCSVCGGSHDCR